MKTKSPQPDWSLWAAEVLDHWADQEDAVAIACPVPDVQVHREREDAFRTAADKFRELAQRIEKEMR